MSSIATPLMDAAIRIDNLSARLDDEVDNFLVELGEMLVKSVQDRIRETKLTPNGEEFEMWAESTARYRERKGNDGQGILWDTGKLLDSIEFEVDGYTLHVGTPVDYAKYLQHGTETMPARPFVGFSEQDLAQIEAMAAKFMEVGTI